MSLSSDGFTMPVAPMGGGFGGGGFGEMSWIWILLIFAMFTGNGWGGGFGGMETLPYFFNTQTQNEVSRGFDTATLTGQLAGIQSSINAGFAGAEVAECNRAMAQMQTDYTNQIASLTQMNALNSSLQSCCCENRANIADLKFTVASEACADRANVNNALRDVMEANTANTQAVLNVLNGGIQSIKDQMCQDKIDAKNERIAALENQLSMAQLAASQTAQTAAIEAGQRALANEVEQYISPNPKPAYIVQSPYCCNTAWNGCGAA